MVCKAWSFDLTPSILPLFDTNVKVFENANEALFDTTIERAKLEEEAWRRENDWEKVEAPARERWWELGASQSMYIPVYHLDYWHASNPLVDTHELWLSAM